MQLHKNIYYMSVVSFLMQFGATIIYCTGNILVKGSLVTAVQLIMIRVFSESLSSFIKVFSGYLSDLTNNRKLFLILGNGSMIVLKVLFLFTTFRNSFPLNFLSLLYTITQIIDRIMNACRDAPRDALIIDFSNQNNRAASFATRKFIASLGTIVGAACSFIIIKFKLLTISKIYFLALIPVIGANIVLIFFVKEKEEKKVPLHIIFLVLAFLGSTVLAICYLNYKSVHSIFVMSKKLSMFLDKRLVSLPFKMLFLSGFALNNFFGKSFFFSLILSLVFGLCCSYSLFIWPLFAVLAIFLLRDFFSICNFFYFSYFLLQNNYKPVLLFWLIIILILYCYKNRTLFFNILIKQNTKIVTLNMRLIQKILCFFIILFFLLSMISPFKFPTPLYLKIGIGTIVTLLSFFLDTTFISLITLVTCVTLDCSLIVFTSFLFLSEAVNIVNKKRIQIVNSCISYVNAVRKSNTKLIVILVMIFLIFLAKCNDTIVFNMCEKIGFAKEWTIISYLLIYVSICIFSPFYLFLIKKCGEKVSLIISIFSLFLVNFISIFLKSKLLFLPLLFLLGSFSASIDAVLNVVLSSRIPSQNFKATTFGLVYFLQGLGAVINGIAYVKLGAITHILCMVTSLISICIVYII